MMRSIYPFRNHQRAIVCEVVKPKKKKNVPAINESFASESNVL